MFIESVGVHDGVRARGGISKLFFIAREDAASIAGEVWIASRE